MTFLGENLEVVPLEDATISYIRKGVGIDMVLKTVLNTVRMFMIYSAAESDRRIYAGVADTIIESRMLGNFGRPYLTLHQVLSIIRSPPCGRTLSWRLQVVSTVLRVLEQFSGDMGCLQKIVVKSWSRATCSFYYRFFKSFSLLFGCLSEIARRPSLREAYLTADRKTLAEKRTALIICDSLIVRNVCDMIVYFKWAPCYTPYKTLEYLCGLLSGIIGVLLVWKDCRYRRVDQGSSDEDERIVKRPSFFVSQGDGDE